MTRAALCSTLGHHDPAADGRCRDCHQPVGDEPVCAPAVARPVAPDVEEGE